MKNYRIVHIVRPLIDKEQVNKTIREETLDVFYYTKTQKPKTIRLQMWSDWEADKKEMELKAVVREYLEKNPF